MPRTSSHIPTNSAHNFGSDVLLKPPHRFSFNGKEGDAEVKGEGNGLDFGARMYDSRLGRWQSPDPSFQKYPGITIYNFSFNNPNIFNDPDGKDGRYTVVQNSSGGGEITISTTVHLYGVHAASFQSKTESLFSQINKPVKYIDAHGKTWTIKYEVTFVQNPELDGMDPQRQGVSREEFSKSKSYEPGDVALCTDCNPPVGYLEEGNWGGHLGKSPGEATVLHAVFHNLGFDDYYDDIGDVMSKNLPNKISAYHSYDVAEKILPTYFFEKEAGKLSGDSSTKIYILIGERIDQIKPDRSAQAGEQEQRMSETFIGPTKNDGSY